MLDAATQILEEANRRFGRAEVYEEAGETRSVRFEHNALKRIGARQFRGVGLRIIHEGRIGFASSTDLRDPRRLVEMAAASVQFGQEARFELPSSPDRLPEVSTEDAAVRDVSHESLVAMGREGLELSMAADSGYLFMADLSTRVETVRVLNSSGLDLAHVKTDMAAVVEVEEVGAGGMLRAYEFKSWGRPFDSVADVTRAALHKMRQARVIAPAPSEVMPVIFTPKAVDNLLGPVMLALSGKQVHKGSSLLAGRVGEQVLDERITILDDATIPFAPDSVPADCEGVPTRRTALFERGVLQSYMLDLQTAGLLGMQTTGNAYRSYADQPSPASSNTVVEAGADDYHEMVSDMERGLIVDQTLGSGQSNVLAGEFSVNVSLGFLVEKGKVQGRVKDCMVAGNVYELLKKVAGIGRQRQWIGSSHLPAICVSGLKLAAQG